MSRRPRGRQRRGQSVELGKWDAFAFECGPITQSVDQLAELWEIHGEDFLEEWARKHPGTRPWIWWHFEAEEPRREINPVLTPGHCLTEAGEEGRKRPGRPLIGNKDSTDLVPWLEEERDYLERLELLMPGELEAIEAAGDEDEDPSGEVYAGF